MFAYECMCACIRTHTHTHIHHVLWDFESPYFAGFSHIYMAWRMTDAEYLRAFIPMSKILCTIDAYAHLFFFIITSFTPIILLSRKLHRLLIHRHGH
jgi:hypothetical protein